MKSGVGREFEVETRCGPFGYDRNYGQLSFAEMASLHPCRRCFMTPWDSEKPIFVACPLGAVVSYFSYTLFSLLIIHQAGQAKSKLPSFSFSLSIFSLFIIGHAMLCMWRLFPPIGHTEYKKIDYSR